MHKWL